MDYGHLPPTGACAGFAIFGLTLGGLGLVLAALGFVLILAYLLRRYFRRDKDISDI